MDIERTFGKWHVFQFVVHGAVALHGDRQIPTVPHHDRIIRQFPTLRSVIWHQKFLAVQNGKKESPVCGFLQGLVKQAASQPRSPVVRHDTDPLDTGNVVPKVPRRGDRPNDHGNVSDDLSCLSVLGGPPSNYRVDRRRAVPNPAVTESLRPVGETQAEQFPNLQIVIRLKVIFVNDLHRRCNRCATFGLGHSLNYVAERGRTGKFYRTPEIGQCRKRRCLRLSLESFIPKVGQRAGRRYWNNTDL